MMTGSSRKTFQSILIAMSLLFVFAASAIAETKLPPTPELPQRASRFEGLINPQTGEVVRTMTPKNPESAQSQKKKSALARYMAGRIAMERRRIPAALHEFEQAIKLDPSSIDPYKAIIPLLLTNPRRVEEAENYALQAAQKTDQGYELVMVMAAVYQRQTKIDQAIDLMERALGTRSIQSGTKEELLTQIGLGLYHRLNKDFDKAAEKYELVMNRILNGDVDGSDLDDLLKNPGQNFDEFGDTFLKAGKPELALKAYEEASKHRVAKPGLHSFNLATVFQQTGKPEEALKSLQEYFDAQQQGRGRAPYVLLESLLKELGKEDELISRLETLLKNDESNDVLRYFLADLVLKNGELPKAKELFSQGEKSVNDPRAQVGLLTILIQEGNAEEIFELLPKAYQRIPRGNDEDTLEQMQEDVRALSESFEAQLDALKENEELITKVFDHARTLKKGDEPSLEFLQAYILGKLATEADDADAAIEFYKFAIGMRNDPPTLLYTEIGGYLLDAKKYEEAIQILNEALANPSSTLQNDRWRLLFFLSYGQEFQGETEQALKTVDEAIRTAPEQLHGRLEYQKAWILYHAHNLDEALTQFQKVIQSFPEDQSVVQDARFRVSAIYVEQGDFPKGEAILEEVLKDDPDNTQANNDLGYLWADQGKNLDKAHKMIQKAIESEPENPAYLDSMGWVLFKKGNYKEAAEYLTKATEQKNGDDSTIFDHLGDALEKLGQHEEAQKNFQRALEIEQEKPHPSEKLLKEIKAKLKSD
ncbi:tetratricopeptide repeat protein [Thalassoglobus polymorphus]|nr:tetratricopeptide repeat protein [Thalassoglobus polymorphus]